jgi:hypothetical protein
MSSNVLKKTGTVLTITGFALWAYGFFSGSFWYANSTMGYLEPVRLWVAGYTQSSIKPGLLEELFGLCVALLGMSFRVAAQYGKGE